MSMDSTLSTRVTTQEQAAPENNFISSKLPWLIAGGAFLVYLVTLNHWVSLSNMPTVARASGWVWQPQLYGPLFWLATFPFRWLPTSTIPVALNLFAAICATLTLALLARSVRLLPHDRTHEQRQREKSPFSILSVPAAWLPPIFAVVVCGLQLSFWEHATVASGEMLDLLLFAYVIRCLLEFRVDARDSWLTRSALVYGLAMTNNWAMIGFFPAYMMALIWIKGLEFFNLRFLGQMCLWGLAGLLLYLLLPITQSTGDVAPFPFWSALKTNLLGQKATLGMGYSYARQNFGNTLLLVIPSLVPVFLIGIRWPSYFGDTSRIGIALATYMFHFVHALLLLACVWVAMDPPISARNQGFGIPFLSFYYLGALSVGYFAGYFLLVFRPQTDRYRRQIGGNAFLTKLATSGVWLLFGVATVVLVYRNLPQIRISNGPIYRQLASRMAQSLPAQPAYILSDDPRRMVLLQAAVTDAGKAKDYVFLDTRALKVTDYHRYLKKRYPEKWKIEVPKGTGQLEDVSLLMLMARLAETNAVYYLHPSFGYYFEYFQTEPHGLIYQLRRYPPNTLVAPVASKEIINENQAFWSSVENADLKIIHQAMVPAPQPPFIQTLFDHAHLLPHTNQDAGVLAGRAADYWGAEMQKAGDLSAAATNFQRALDLNPDNVVAQVNLEYNKNLQAGQISSVTLSKSVEDAFGKFRSWDQLLSENGPFDEPNYCFEQGRIFARTSLYRQAATEFDRAMALDPLNLPARLWLAQLYVVSRLPDQAVKIIDEIHSQPDRLKVTRTNQTELLYIEASARLAKGDVAHAEQTIQSALKKSPGDAEDLLATATRVYMAFGNYTNAIAALDEQLKIAPDNASALVNKGYAYMQMSDYEQAIPPLNKALSIQTNDYSALLNRAICYFRAKQFDNAQRDYESLQKLNPTDFKIYYGLGEIAYNKKDTNAAIRNFQLYLTNSPPNNEEAKFVMARLKELKPGTP